MILYGDPRVVLGRGPFSFGEGPVAGRNESASPVHERFAASDARANPPRAGGRHRSARPLPASHLDCHLVSAAASANVEPRRRNRSPTIRSFVSTMRRLGFDPPCARAECGK